MSYHTKYAKSVEVENHTTVVPFEFVSESAQGIRGNLLTNLSQFFDTQQDFQQLGPAVLRAAHSFSSLGPKQTSLFVINC